MPELSDERYKLAIQKHHDERQRAAIEEAESIANRLLRGKSPKPRGLGNLLERDIWLRPFCRVDSLMSEYDPNKCVFLQTIHDLLDGSECYPNGFQIGVSKPLRGTAPSRLSARDQLRREALHFYIETPPRFKEPT